MIRKERDLVSSTTALYLIRDYELNGVREINPCMKWIDQPMEYTRRVKVVVSDKRSTPLHFSDTVKTIN